MEAVVSPDGSRLANVQTTGPGKSQIYTAGLLAGDAKPAHVTAGGSDEHGLAWSPDSKQLVFLSDHEKAGQLQLYVSSGMGGAARQLTHLTGLLAEPHWSPDGKRIAILFTENLPRAAGPLDPVLPDSGVVESKNYEQRLATVDAATGAVRQLSPADYYIYAFQLDTSVGEGQHGVFEVV